MRVGRHTVARIAGFALLTLAFAVTNPLVLVAIPIAVLLVAFGPRGWPSALVLAAVAAVTLLGGERSGLWWFERGWPLLLAGAFVWVTAWRPALGFFPRTLVALAVAATAGGAIFALDPGTWAEVDAAMSAKALGAAEAVAELVGSSESTLEIWVRRLAGIQAAVFPALLALSSVAALGIAVLARERLAREPGVAIGAVRNFRFNDHLIWLWLAGLALLLAPVGAVAERVGGNAVVFMGLLYVFRGFAVGLTLLDGVSILTGVVGGLVALLVYPLFLLMLGAALLLGLGDTWIDLRHRLARREPEG